MRDPKIPDCRRDVFATMRDAYEAAHTYTLGKQGSPFRCPSCRLWHVEGATGGPAR